MKCLTYWSKTANLCALLSCHHPELKVELISSNLTPNKFPSNLSQSPFYPQTCEVETWFKVKSGGQRSVTQVLIESFYLLIFSSNKKEKIKNCRIPTEETADSKHLTAPTEDKTRWRFTGLWYFMITDWNLETSWTLLEHLHTKHKKTWCQWHQEVVEIGVQGPQNVWDISHHPTEMTYGWERRAWSPRWWERWSPSADQGATRENNMNISSWRATWKTTEVIQLLGEMIVIRNIFKRCWCVSAEKTLSASTSHQQNITAGKLEKQ